MLAHLKDRALTLKRYPDGVDAPYFFEKRCPSHRPAWVKTAEVPYGSRKRMTVCLANDLETLIWVENLAAIELHVPLAKASSPDNPDSVVFDLDPGDGAGFTQCAQVALLLKKMFAGMKLVSIVKTSGKKGLHVYIPLNSKKTTYAQTKAFSKAAAETLEKNYPALVTSKMAKEERKNRVFINWSQNDASKTMACAYTLRAGAIPAASCPLEWGEVEKWLNTPEKFTITHAQTAARAKKNGDIFSMMYTKKQKLPFL